MPRAPIKPHLKKRCPPTCLSKLPLVFPVCLWKRFGFRVTRSYPVIVVSEPSSRNTQFQWLATNGLSFVFVLFSIVVCPAFCKIIQSNRFHWPALVRRFATCNISFSKNQKNLYHFGARAAEFQIWITVISEFAFGALQSLRLVPA